MNNVLMKRWMSITAGILMSIASARANTAAATAEISFKGSSTLHDFEGTAMSHPFVAIFNENAEQGQLTVSAKTSIEVADMTTNHTKRDRNMFKMFDLEHFARIEGELPETLVSETESTQTNLRLTICGEPHDVTATISQIERDGKQLNCRMSFPVSLKAFHLKGPSVLGLIRVDDTVLVECSIHGEIGKKVAGN